MKYLADKWRRIRWVLACEVMSMSTVYDEIGTRRVTIEMIDRGSYKRIYRTGAES